MTKPDENKEAPQATGERLQKILAHAGVASRRAAEELIAAGRVTVNGKVVTEMGVRANPLTDAIAIDGKPLGKQPATEREEQAGFVYIALNKPVGVVSTAKDPQGRPTVLDVIQGTAGNATRSAAPEPKSKTPNPTPRTGNPELPRLYPVGRLDADTTGLILITNDGELTFRLTHPSYGVEKEYRALVRGRPTEGDLARLREGVEVEGETTSPARVEEVSRHGNDTWLRVVIHEGRKRQVRLMMAAVGHPVAELQRVRFGPIALGDLAPGKWRKLAVYEVQALLKAVRLKRYVPASLGRPGPGNTSGPASRSRSGAKPGAVSRPGPGNRSHPASKPAASSTPGPASRTRPGTRPEPASKPGPASRPAPGSRPRPTSRPAPGGKPRPARTTRPEPASKPGPASRPAPGDRSRPAARPGPGGRQGSTHERPGSRPGPGSKPGAENRRPGSRPGQRERRPGTPPGGSRNRGGRNG